MTNAAIQGTVERYLSGPSADGFAILSLRTPTGKLVVKGRNVINGYGPGETVEITGTYKDHPKFGKQMEAVNSRAIIPSGTAGLEKWLVQTGIPGVGEATARKLIALYGTNVIDRIASRDQQAKEILGERYEAAVAKMIEHRAEEVMGPLLAEHDIGPTLRKKIFQHYGLSTAATINADPYRLIMDIEGIAFATADKIAGATGIAKLSRTRLIAAAIDVLRKGADDGHTVMDNQTLARGIIYRAQVPADVVIELLEDLDHHLVVAATVETDKGNFDGWALRKLDRAEGLVADAIMDKLQAPTRISRQKAEDYVRRAEEIVGKTLNVEQRAAAITAISTSISIVTGGPGTGKTTVLEVICKAIKLAAAEGVIGGRIKLGSPTGKASQRMNESTGMEASTMHRLMEVDPKDGGFIKGEDNPIDADFIAIDETSMTDIPLAASFVKAWGDAIVLFIGDPDQLLSVGAGRFLGDLIDSGVVPVSRLTQIRRQKEGSAIALGAASIRAGKMPQMGEDLLFIEQDDNEDMQATIRRLHKAFVEDGMSVQVLTPGHQSEVGTIALNAILQKDAGRTGQELTLAGGSKANVGDKVLQVENDHDLEVYNGDSGIIDAAAVNDGKIRAAVTFGKRSIMMDSTALTKLALAYALSVHKSQGSEYEVVIIPVTASHWSLLRRSLIYTGMTRARQICIFVGQRRALRQAISVDDSKMRMTTLAKRLAYMAAAC